MLAFVVVYIVSSWEIIMQYSDRLALRSPRDRVKSTIILQTVPETVTVDGRHRFYLPQPVHLVPSTTSAWPCLRSTNYANDKDARSSYPQAPSMPVLLGYTSGAKHVSHTTQLDLMEVISEKLLYVQYSLFSNLLFSGGRGFSLTRLTVGQERRLSVHRP